MPTQECVDLFGERGRTHPFREEAGKVLDEVFVEDNWETTAERFLDLYDKSPDLDAMSRALVDEVVQRAMDDWQEESEEDEVMPAETYEWPRMEMGEHLVAARFRRQGFNDSFPTMDGVAVGPYRVKDSVGCWILSHETRGPIAYLKDHVEAYYAVMALIRCDLSEAPPMVSLVNVVSRAVRRAL